MHDTVKSSQTKLQGQAQQDNPPHRLSQQSATGAVTASIFTKAGSSTVFTLYVPKFRAEYN